MTDSEGIDPVRVGFGLRLKAAREGKSLTQQDVATRFGVNKATVSAWETGRGAPDAFVLRQLAKLYDVSADALLWEESLSPDAMKIATEYDHLPEKKKRDWSVLWLGFITGSAPGGERLPLAPGVAEPEAPYGDDDREDELARRVIDTSSRRPASPSSKQGKKSG